MNNSGYNVEVIQGLFELSTEKMQNKHFSIIILSSLLHEVEKPQLFLQSIENIAAKDSIIHLNVPNGRSFHRLLALESGLIGDVAEFSNNNIVFQQHNVFTMDTLLEIIKNSIQHEIEVLDFGSYFVKPFTHQQMTKMLNENIINENILDGFQKMIKYMPEIGSEIFIDFKIKL